MKKITKTPANTPVKGKDVLDKQAATPHKPGTIMQRRIMFPRPIVEPTSITVEHKTVSKPNVAAVPIDTGRVPFQFSDGQGVKTSNKRGR